MAPDAQPAGTSGEPQAPPSGRLAAGARLAGGRYTVESLTRRGRFGEIYRAVDSTTGSPVSVHLLDSEILADPAVASDIEQRSRAVTEVAHANICALHEVVFEGDQSYLITDVLEGHTLRQLLARKQETGGRGFNAKGAATILGQLCGALAAAHPGVVHGALTLESVVVDRSGQARVFDFGLSPAVPKVAARAGDAAFAPEVAAGQPATAAADVFSLGAILYELVVGTAPRKGCQRPSEAVPGIDPKVDAVVAGCMHPNPANRPADINAVKKHATEALNAKPASNGQSAQQPVAAAKKPSRPSLAQSLTSPPSAAEPVAQSSASDSMNAMVTAAMADSAERYLVSKGKLDFGPFTFQGLVDQVRANQVMPKHTIIDNFSGEKCTAEDHPLLGEIVEQAKQKRDDARRAQAEVKVAKQEKRRGFGLIVFIGLTVVGLGAGAYFVVKQLSADDSDDNAAVAEIEEGSIGEAKFSFPTADKNARRGRKGRKGRRGSGGAGGVAGGWDDSVDLGDASEGGGDERLSDSQINPVIQRKGGALSRCLSKTGSRSANVSFIVKGTGKVAYVKVNGSTGSPLAKCIRGVMMGMKFPSFDGARTKANFSMSM